MDKIFISYHRDSALKWVEDSLTPVLDASGLDVVMDTRDFTAGKPVVGQMDALQDEAKTQLLVMTTGYLQSDYCVHEMERAINNIGFASGRIIPIMLEPMVLPQTPHAPLRVEFHDKRKDREGWALLCRSLGIDFGVGAEQWLNTLHRVIRYLKRNDTTHLHLVTAKIAWRPIINQLQKKMPGLGLVDFHNGLTVPLDGAIELILQEAKLPCKKIKKGRAMQVFAHALNQQPNKIRQVWVHFDEVFHRKAFNADFFAALRYQIMEGEKNFIPLVVSREEIDDKLRMRSNIAFKKIRL